MSSLRVLPPAPWIWLLGPGQSVTIQFTKEPTWEHMQQLQRILDVTHRAFEPPKVTPLRVAGVRVVALWEPLRGAA